jgi:predicted HTH transcriptional regulator
LGGRRDWNRDLEQRILDTVCGIANLGDDGDIFIGVADDIQDANRVQALDGVTPIKISNRYVVGVEREAAILNIDVEAYMRRIIDKLRNSSLTTREGSETKEVTGPGILAIQNIF